MTNRRTLVLGAGGLALAGFGAAAYVFKSNQASKAPEALQESSPLVRPHSPILGPANAPVTIVEFFDPACETCRAVYPVVKQIMGNFPNKTRLVLRYATLHKGSDEAAQILETARLQGMFEPVLVALLVAQPVWASHSRPQIEEAWAAAGRAGLDVTRARRERQMPHIVATLKQDMADVATLGIRQTPTFFVNGKPLPSFGMDQLFALVRSEVAATETGAGTPRS